MSLSELLQMGEVLHFYSISNFIFQIFYISPGDIYHAVRIRPWHQKWQRERHHERKTKCVYSLCLFINNISDTFIVFTSGLVFFFSLEQIYTGRLFWQQHCYTTRDVGVDAEQKGPWCFNTGAECSGGKGGKKSKLPTKYSSGTHQYYKDRHQCGLHSTISLQRKFARNADAYAEQRGSCFEIVAYVSGFKGIGAQRRFGRLVIVDLQYFLVAWR